MVRQMYAVGQADHGGAEGARRPPRRRPVGTRVRHPPTVIRLMTWNMAGSQFGDEVDVNLDFVFASVALADRVQVRALNESEEWGGSEHCTVRIDVDV
jgi:exonuclease III